MKYNRKKLTFHKYCMENAFGIGRIFKESLMSRRARSLELSQYREMERWRVSSTHCLDLERNTFRYLIAGSNDGSVAIYDLEVFSQTPQETCSIIASVNRNSSRAHTSICSWIQWHVSDTGIFTTSSRDKSLKVWDTNNMKPVDKYQFDRAVFQHSLAPFCAKTSIIAVATACSNVNLVDLISGTKTQQLRGHKAGVICVQWSPTDPNVLASSGQDGQIFIWDIRSAKTQLAALCDNSSSSSTPAAHSHAITGLKFTEDGFYLLSLDTEGYTKLWNGRTLCRMPNFTSRKLTGNLVIRAVGLDFAYHTSFSNEIFAFVPDEANVEVLRLSDGLAACRSLAGHYSIINSCAYRSPYQELYSAGFDQNILVWQPQTDLHIDYSEVEPGKRIAENWSEVESD